MNEETKFISDEDMIQTVERILNSFPDAGVRGFRMASKQFDSNFFEGESQAFTQMLAKGLHAKFLPFVNNYWKSLIREDVSE